MKVNKEEIVNQFFYNGREGLDPELQRRLLKSRPSVSHEFKSKTIWPDLEEVKTSTSYHNIFIKS